MYTIVPDYYRSFTYPRRHKNLQPKRDKLIEDLMAGKTVLLDDPVPLGVRYKFNQRQLYNYFNARGYRLRVHMIDNIDKDIFRRVVLWLDRMTEVYACRHCEIVEAATLMGPPVRGCIGKRNHRWKRLSRVSFKDGVARKVA